MSQNRLSLYLSLPLCLSLSLSLHYIVFVVSLFLTFLLFVVMLLKGCWEELWLMMLGSHRIEKGGRGHNCTDSNFTWICSRLTKLSLVYTVIFFYHYQIICNVKGTSITIHLALPPRHLPDALKEAAVEATFASVSLLTLQKEVAGDAERGNAVLRQRPTGCPSLLSYMWRDTCVDTFLLGYFLNDISYHFHWYWFSILGVQVINHQSGGRFFLVGLWAKSWRV